MPSGSGQLVIPNYRVSSGSGSSADEQVKITAADTASGFLQAKVISSDASISFAVSNPGGVEQLDMTVTGATGAQPSALVAPIIRIGASQTVGARFGADSLTPGVRALRAGQVVGLSVLSAQPFTVGQVVINVALNGVRQNGLGESLVLSGLGPQQAALIDFATPVSFISTDNINVVAESDNVLTPVNVNLTVIVWFQLT